MSATGRTDGVERVKNDFYPTDPRITHSLLRAIDRGYGPPLPGGLWCEPACGNWAMVKAVNGFYLDRDRQDYDWLTCDIRPESQAMIVGDFLADDSIGRGSSVFLTNPPYGDFDESGKRVDLAMAFVKACIERRAPGGHVYMLLRYGFANAVKRQPLIAQYKPDVYSLTPRPSFGLNKHGKPGNDSCEYVFLAFTPTSDLRLHFLNWKDPDAPIIGPQHPVYLPIGNSVATYLPV